MNSTLKKLGELPPATFFEYDDREYYKMKPIPYHMGRMIEYCIDIEVGDMTALSGRFGPDTEVQPLEPIGFRYMRDKE